MYIYDQNNLVQYACMICEGPALLKRFVRTLQVFLLLNLFFHFFLRGNGMHPCAGRAPQPRGRGAVPFLAAYGGTVPVLRRSGAMDDDVIGITMMITMLMMMWLS